MRLTALPGDPALVRLRAFERGDKRVGQHGRVVRRRPAAVVVVEHDGGGGGEAVERDVEAELEGLALERVGVGAEAGGAEEPRRREHGAGDVERGHLRVAAPPGQGHGLPHHGRRLRRQRLLHGAAAGAHLLSLLAEISSLQFASNVRAQRVSGSPDPLATCDDPF